MSLDLKLDFFDMDGREGFGQEELSKIAQEVKDPLLGKDDLRRLLDSEFGIILVLPNGDKLRKFPLANRSLTMSSVKAFNANHDKLPEEAKAILAHRINLACQRYKVTAGNVIDQTVATTQSEGIYYPVTHDMMMLMLDMGSDEEFTEREEDAFSKGAHFAITKDIHGKPMEKFQISTKKQLSRQLEHFEKQALSWYPSYSIQMASNMLKRAEELGFEIPSDSLVHLYTGKEFSKTAYLNIDARIMKAAGQPELQARYFDIKGKIASGSCTPQQITVMLDKADRDASFHFCWSNRQSRRGGLFQNPAEAILSNSKTASEEMESQGNIIDISGFADMLNNREDLLRSHFSEQEIEDMKEDPEGAIKAMPAPQREIVLTLLAENS